MENDNLTDDAISLETVSTPSNIRLKFITSIIILISSLFCFAARDNHLFFTYSKLLGLCYSLLLLFYSWRQYRDQNKENFSLVWYQLLQWVGLFFAAYMITLFNDTELLNNTQAAYVMLIMIALTLFITGVYSDICFMLTGINLMANCYWMVSFSHHHFVYCSISTFLFCIFTFVFIYLQNHKIFSRQ
jgi:hypothetical protein